MNDRLEIKTAKEIFLSTPTMEVSGKLNWPTYTLRTTTDRWVKLDGPNNLTAKLQDAMKQAKSNKTGYHSGGDGYTATIHEGRAAAFAEVLGWLDP